MLTAGMSASGALRQLAEQDPFINIRKNDEGQVEPGEPDSGIVFRRSVELGSLTHTGYASPVSAAGDPASTGVSP